ncbi:DUF502 domain-containing protein [Magnetovibrio blakemorei]|uniref:DUF502 domain-containing protein n=1 Tax=Magnetovibrio blakemorei TaxID=28181 RepID=A0A1E5Q7A3_9PROT|nr:DUF502 domain-containing protein [Magnetovibrio blakemorei]OEJ66864.1 hypothetical protein BEN30_10710 [Magnetovibrio blakemorei]
MSDEISPSSSNSKPARGGVLGKLRGYFIAGILITAPISITIYLGWAFVTYVDSKVTPLFPAKYNPENYLPFGVPGLGVVVLVIGLILIGAFTAGFMGRFFQRSWEGIMDNVPVLRGVYKALKQILETILAQQSNAFREAVLVEYPRRGMWVIAFITGKTQGEVQSLTEKEVINLFVPTTPNPTSGFLIFVPREDMVSLSMSVEDALKMVISGGIVTPPDDRPQDERPKNVVRSTENTSTEE